MVFFTSIILYFILFKTSRTITEEHHTIIQMHLNELSYDYSPLVGTSLVLLVTN